MYSNPSMSLFTQHLLNIDLNNSQKISKIHKKTSNILKSFDCVWSRIVWNLRDVKISFKFQMTTRDLVNFGTSKAEVLSSKYEHGVKTILIAVNTSIVCSLYFRWLKSTMSKKWSLFGADRFFVYKINFVMYQSDFLVQRLSFYDNIYKLWVSSVRSCVLSYLVLVAPGICLNERNVSMVQWTCHHFIILFIGWVELKVLNESYL